jgi:hypothetical protein
MAQRRHRFVITEQDRHLAAALGRLAAEAQQQRQRLRGSVAAVENVSQLHQLGATPGPLEAPIDQLGATQDFE